MGFLDNLESSLNSLERQDERAQSGEAERRAAERSRALSTQPWAEKLKNSQYTKDLFNKSAAAGHRIRAKVYIAWIEQHLRLEARGRILELKPTSDGIVAEFTAQDGAPVRHPVDLKSNPSDLLDAWLAGETAPSVPELQPPKGARQMSDARVYAAAAIAGGVAGLRSMMAPAIVSQFTTSGLLHNPAFAAIAPVLAVGEAIADKLPFMPNRTLPGSVVVRAISGGLSGAGITSGNRRPVFWGVVIGAAAAIGTTYAAFYLRRGAAKSLHVPDALVAFAEDALAVAAGVSALRAITARTES